MLSRGWKSWCDFRHHRRRAQEIYRRWRCRLGFPLPPMMLPTWQPYYHPQFGSGLAISVAGQPMWVCSADAALSANPVAALCAIAPWAVQNKHDIVGVTGVIPPQVCASIQAATAVMGRWWNHQPLGLPEFSAVPENEAAPQSVIHFTTALFFSGGVDSFHNLLRDPSVRVMVFVVGFDIALSQQAVWQAMMQSFRVIAAKRGVRLIVLTTNMRDHHALGAVNWERAHGAALACMGHLLRDHAQRFLISASFQASNLKPWGTHPNLDALWGDNDISFVHAGCEL